MDGKPVEEDEGRPDKVYLWRLKQLTLLGISEEQAAGLASNRSVDLERARNLRESGCKPSLIVEILS